MKSVNEMRDGYRSFVESFFGPVSSESALSSDLAMLKVAPEGLPKCFLSCGRSFGEEQPFELMFSTSPDFDEKGEKSLGKELLTFCKSIQSFDSLPPVMPLQESICGFSHVLPWPVAEWEQIPIFVLIPISPEEAQWIQAHSAEEFALAYHGQVSEEAFFNLDVSRAKVETEREELNGLCEFH